MHEDRNEVVGQEFEEYRRSSSKEPIHKHHLPRFSHSFRAYFANYRAIKSAALRLGSFLHDSRQPLVLYHQPGTYLNTLGAANKINLSAPYKKRRSPFFNSCTAGEHRYKLQTGMILMSIFNGSSFAFKKKE